MNRFFVVFLLILSCQNSWAELVSPRVPTVIEFADMRLKLTDGARQKIQKEVDQLTRSETYYNIKADRIKLYFPIIEKTLRAEGVPEDFKYLSVQESALISDAVSSANAVGFWQFKDFTGREVGLRIDRKVDERLNIVSSTIGAAKYFKRHNFHFDNWVYTLLAHMTGQGGAAKYVDKSKFGSKKLTIDRNTHWYVIRFLSHKIAFESADKGPHSEGLKLTLYEKGGGKTLDRIAKNGDIDISELKRYNKWLKSGAVPEDKEYAVLIPSFGKAHKIKEDKKSGPTPQIAKIGPVENAVYPSLVDGETPPGTIMLKINGLPCILAKAKDDWASLANTSGLSEEKIVKYNDLTLGDKPVEGEIYYLKPKRNKSDTYYYTAQQNETLWDVSQKFGVKEVKLAKLNRMSIIDEVKPGRVMWLKKRRPEEILVEYRAIPAMPVDETISVKEIIKEAKSKPKMEIDTLEVDDSKDEEILIKESGSDLLVDITNHEVVKGESLYSIAEDFEVTISDIVEWNNLPNYHLSIGQKMVIHGTKLPEVDEPEDEVELELNEEEVTSKKIDFHIVEPGDTMYGISRKYDVDVKVLLKINEKDNFDLKIGERLQVRE